MKKLILLLPILAMLCIQTKAFAWGQTGHRVVAEVCMRNLNPEAKRAIKRILKEDLLSEVSTWADYVKSEDECDFARSWHYINIDPNESLDQVMLEANKDTNINNVVEAIMLMTKVLEGEKKSISKFQSILKKNNASLLNESLDATALALLIHFMGDLHQPLHVGKAEDKGGNDVKVKFFWENRNLHSVWDSGIIDEEQLSFTEFADYVGGQSQKEVNEINNGSVLDWTAESFKYRLEIYEDLEKRSDGDEKPELSYDYQHDYLPLVKQRLLEAGLRSAYLLNEIFKAEK